MVRLKLSRKISRYLHYYLVAFLLAGCLSFMVTYNQSYDYNEDNYQELGGSRANEDFQSRLIGPVSADDHTLQIYLKKHFMLPPSTEDYNLTTNKKYLAGCNIYSWPYIHQHLQTAFGDSNKGFFIEAGALDGQCLSNTLWLEKEKGWTGLLIEPDTQNYMDMVYKKRKSWISNTCLSTTMFASRMKFISMRKKGPSADPLARGLYVPKDFDMTKEEIFTMKSFHFHKTFNIQCFPLYSYLSAINVTVVDFLSLDIQGPELKVFLTLPLDKILVRMVIIEDELYGFDNFLVNTMNAKGFVLVKVGGAPDYIFINRNETEMIDKFRPGVVQDLLDGGGNITVENYQFVLHNPPGKIFLDKA